MKPDLESPTLAEAAFYEAFRRLDVDRMATVWTDSADVFCVHPGGPLLTGRDAVLGSWLEIFAQADPPQLEYRLVHREQRADIAVHLVEEHIRPSGSRAEGAALVLATNVYILTERGWEMLSHHASTPMVGRETTRPARHMH